MRGLRSGHITSGDDRCGSDSCCVAACQPVISVGDASEGLDTVEGALDKVSSLAGFRDGGVQPVAARLVGMIG